MSAWISALTTFIGEHPHWAGVFVFLIAASEAVVVIGYIIPGTAILLAVGSIVGLGHLPLLPILVWAAGGAVLGDGFSFWLGHTYQEGLRRRWPFSRYPDLIDRGEAFFHRHGGKSVFLGRFVPLLKPIIPTVAGILGMPPGRFYLANVVSAVFWSPAHILPGVLVGASLGLLHGISARLVVFALGVLALAVLLVWGARLGVARLAPVLNRVHRQAFDWAMARPGTLVRRLARPFDPDRPGLPALAASLTVLVGVSLALVGVVEDVVTRDPLVRADGAISNFLTGLRNAWTDPVMVAVTAMGDAAVIVPLVLTVPGWLVVMRAWRLAGAVSIAFASAGATVLALKALVQMPRPEAMYSGVDAFAFPSGHTTMATVLFGLAAWLAAGGLRAGARVLVYTMSFGWVLAIAVSRVYLGAHWPSDVLAGLLIGSLVCVTVAVLQRHSSRAHLRPGWFALLFTAVFVAAGTWHVTDSYPRQVARYAPSTSAETLSTQAWRDGLWRSLPARRLDLAGEREETLSVQWLGSAAALESRLLARGWQHPPAWTAASAAGYLKPATPIAELPTVAALHDGRKPVVLLVRGAGTPGERWVLRAWPSGFEAGTNAGQTPLLVASLLLQRETHPGGLFTRLVGHQTEPLPRAVLEAFGGHSVTRADGASVRLAEGDSADSDATTLSR